MQPSFEEQVEAMRRWFAAPRFKGIQRLYTAREVVEQRGTIAAEYPVARDAADAFYKRLRQLFDEKKYITTFNPYSPNQTITIKHINIKKIYLNN